MTRPACCPPPASYRVGQRSVVWFAVLAALAGSVLVVLVAWSLRPGQDDAVVATSTPSSSSHPLQPAHQMVLLFADDLAAHEDIELLTKRRDELDAERQRLRLAGVDVGPLEVALTYVDVQLSIGVSDDRDAAAEYVRGGAKIMQDLMDRK